MKKLKIRLPMKKFEKLMKNQKIKKLQVIALVLAGIFVFSCGRQSVDQIKSNSAPEKKISEFERELKYMKTADFNYIFAFSRKDGKPLDSEDKKFLKHESRTANRHTLTKDGKTAFVGTNYKLSDKSLEKLKKRFFLEDFSKSSEQNQKREKKSITPNKLD